MKPIKLPILRSDIRTVASPFTALIKVYNFFSFFFRLRGTFPMKLIKISIYKN